MSEPSASGSEQQKPSLPVEVLSRLSPESRECIQRLLDYVPPPLLDFGLVKQGAVLVALFERPEEGRLRVLLTTRAKTLRRHPGLTALPGGKVDPEDPGPEHTARREAFEEVGLPLFHPSIHQITVLPPVLTVLPLNAHMKNHIVVTPVVCFISDLSVIDSLRSSPDEVDHIFSHPLRGILDGGLGDVEIPGLAEKGTEWWPYEEDFYLLLAYLLLLASPSVRSNAHEERFRSTHSPIKGMTADVLLECAAIAYAKPPAHPVLAPAQLPFADAIASVVRDLPGVLEADKEAALAGIVREVGRPEWGSGVEGITVASAEAWSVR